MHLDISAVTAQSQHGCVKNKPCQKQINSCLDWIISLADGGNAVDVIYLDFNKIFDKVPRDILIVNKLVKYQLPL